jgi:hypothetical protein
MISGIVTATLLVVFVAGWAWAWSPRRRKASTKPPACPAMTGRTHDEQRMVVVRHRARRDQHRRLRPGCCGGPASAARRSQAGRHQSLWDGDITEYNKPLPKWWINLFWMTIVVGIGYLLWYPGWARFAGYGKWTSPGEHDQQKAATREAGRPFAPYRGQSIDVLAQDPAACAWGARSSTTPARPATARPRRVRSATRT